LRGSYIIILTLVVCLFFGVNSAFAEKIPDWVKNIFIWYGQDQISEDELLDTLEFLIESRIIEIEYPDLTFEYYDDYSFEMTSEDCFDFEVFDPVEKLCYVECYSTQECIEIEQQILADADSIWDSAMESEQYQIQPADEESYVTLITTYDVNGNEIVLNKKHDVSDDLIDWQENIEKHNEIWELFTSLIPKQSRSDVSAFTIYTDGRDGEMAAVERDQQDPSKWILSIDIIDVYPSGNFDEKEITYSLIHEFGHILTAGALQVDIDPELLQEPYSEINDYLLQEEFMKKEQECSPKFMTFDGCTKSDSYLNVFFQTFWRDIYSEFNVIQSIEDDNQYYEELDLFYEKYNDRFVTDYASENPDEDIAESWTAFVLNEKPVRKSIAEEKILFFYDYSELVKLRDAIRNRL